MNKVTRQAARQAAETHQNALRQSLERRMEVARAKGDQQLLRQLEAEANYLR
jgi:hypothetical protein